MSVIATVKNRKNGHCTTERFDTTPRVGEYVCSYNDYWVVVAVIHDATDDGNITLLVEKADKPQ